MPEYTFGSVAITSVIKEAIQSLGNQLSPLSEEFRKTFHCVQFAVRWDTLGIQGIFALVLYDVWKILDWFLVADLPVCLPADKGKIGDVIDDWGLMVTLQQCSGEDVVKLKLMLFPTV